MSSSFRRRRAGKRENYPRQLELEDGYADFLEVHGPLARLFRGLFSKLVYAEIVRTPFLLLKPAFLKHLIFFAGYAELTRDWLLNWMRKLEIEPRACLFYTYWFNEVTVGVGLARGTWPDMRLVGRAHRYDLYAEVNTPPYWPCHEFALSRLDAVFSASQDGADYLRQRYPGFESKIKISRLGIQSTGIQAQPSSDHIYRIVSCSKLVPVKRVALLMQGIAAAAERRPSQGFVWHHLGNGPLKQSLETSLSRLPANVTACFASYSTQADVFRFYRDHPVDAFVNTSASEGIPVAIMEAISCGIPVIATDVGGTKEIVSEKNGFLISANPSPEQIADALLSCWDAPGERRAGSLEASMQEYGAQQNYSDFVQRLVRIRA